jgi:hypothetical protein
MPRSSKVFYFNVDTDSNRNSINASTVKHPVGTVGSAILFSNKEEGSGYYNGDGFHSVTYVPWPETDNINYGENNNFRGSIVIQATLAEEPNEGDWVDITSTLTTFDGTNNFNTFHNFSGNFVWIRAKVTVNQGVLRQILFNH